MLAHSENKLDLKVPFNLRIKKTKQTCDILFSFYYRLEKLSKIIEIKTNI